MGKLKNTGSENIFKILDSLQNVLKIEKLNSTDTMRNKGLDIALETVNAIRRKINNNSDISTRTLDITKAAEIIKSMPLGQAIQLIKSNITGLPETQTIKGELVVVYVE